MYNQKSGFVTAVRDDKVWIEFDDGTRACFPLSKFPEGTKKGDKLKVGLETIPKYVIPVNGEDVTSAVLKCAWNGYQITFYSTSDSGRVEVVEAGKNALRVIYCAGSKRIPLGIIHASWDPHGSFAALQFVPLANPDIDFKYGGKVSTNPMDLFYERTTFEIISEGETVSVVNVRGG